MSHLKATTELKCLTQGANQGSRIKLGLEHMTILAVMENLNH